MKHIFYLRSPFVNYIHLHLCWKKRKKNICYLMHTTRWSFIKQGSCDLFRWSIWLAFIPEGVSLCYLKPQLMTCCEGNEDSLTSSQHRLKTLRTKYDDFDSCKLTLRWPYNMYLQKHRHSESVHFKSSVDITIHSWFFLYSRNMMSNFY